MFDIWIFVATAIAGYIRTRRWAAITRNSVATDFLLYTHRSWQTRIIPDDVMVAHRRAVGTSILKWSLLSKLMLHISNWVSHRSTARTLQFSKFKVSQALICARNDLWVDDCLGPCTCFLALGSDALYFLNYDYLMYTTYKKKHSLVMEIEIRKLEVKAILITLFESINKCTVNCFDIMYIIIIWLYNLRLKPAFMNERCNYTSRRGEDQVL